MTQRRYSPTYRFIAGVVKPFLWLMGRKRWSGTENLHRPEGFIAAANHASLLDPLATAHVLYNNGAPPRIMAKAELWKVFGLGALLRGSGQIPVERRTRQAADSLVAAQAALEAGECVLIFPEGTLTLDPNAWPMVAHTGVARLALTSGAPVIPLAQWGSTAILPRKAKFPTLRRTTFQALVGEPVDLTDLRPQPGAQPTPEALAEGTRRIMAAITTQLAQLRGETPPAEPFDRRKAGV